MPKPKIEVNFASNNRYKISEVMDILGGFNIVVNPVNLKVREIQADNLEEIAADSAKTTAYATRKIIVVEDAGLFIDSLGGFPGPYSSYIHSRIGCKGILKLMKGISARDATFRSAVSYCEPGNAPKVFIGEINGQISQTERPGREFGYDPIFLPQGSIDKTFSEMSDGEKNGISHRCKSFSKLANWLLRER